MPIFYILRLPPRWGRDKNSIKYLYFVVLKDWKNYDFLSIFLKVSVDGVARLVI